MKKLSSDVLFHCFGTEKSEPVTPELAARMISVSKLKQIPINTHRIDKVEDWKELNLGYGNATWNTVSKFIDLSDCTPVWNINLPTSADEAIARTHKAVKLGGKRPIKLEVLDKSLTWNVNSEIEKAVNVLMNKEKLDIWPLVAPKRETLNLFDNWGCSLIRIMGSPISSGQGISSENELLIKEFINEKKTKIMLDGGIGSPEHVLHALDLGFDKVLVNSCLFKDSKDPVDILEKIIDVITAR